MKVKRRWDSHFPYVVAGKKENEVGKDGRIRCYDGENGYFFAIMTGKVIKRWDLGIEAMKKGQHAIFTIPAELACVDEKVLSSLVKELSKKHSRLAKLYVKLFHLMEIYVSMGKCRSLRVCQGTYDAALIRAWEEWDWKHEMPDLGVNIDDVQDLDICMDVWDLSSVEHFDRVNDGFLEQIETRHILWERGVVLFGHYRKDCPERKGKKKDNSETVDAGVVEDNFDGADVLSVTISSSDRGKVWVYILKKKSDVFVLWKQSKMVIEKQTGKEIKFLRTDDGMDFCLDEFTEDMTFDESSMLSKKKKLVDVGKDHSV
ncbi:hypothetical protein RJ639_039877 [Escallonia herrerae]|uniref:Rotamase n=1 Tax=Escallonia herrerae TaxID=1293975 RepID=A0AA88WQ40_9ASTE|nr:hypothetical protein RJ639_039877 [Escallonia herrerae]